MNDTFLRACRGEQTSYTPIWLMRQAGRYQAEYRAIREKVSFLELCHSPDLAAQVTVFAVEQLNVDAAIIFADILLILEPLGCGFSFEKDMGPKIHTPIRTTAQIDAIAEAIDPVASLGYVGNSIRVAKRDLKVPLIGFAGAPFTLASYAIEGGSSRDYLETKKLMFEDEGAWNALMTKVTRATIAYLQSQVDAGADALQVFDSWIGALSENAYRRYVLPHMKTLFAALPSDIPTIYFGTGNPELYGAMGETAANVIGVDWRIDLADAWTRVPGKNIMGNLDPAALRAGGEPMCQAAQEVLDSAAGRAGHIFNLGHGIMPQAKVADAQRLVAYVHEASER